MCSLLAKPAITDHPVDIGHRTEAAILARLVERGYNVLVPFGVNQRYDLVIESDGRFFEGPVQDGPAAQRCDSVQVGERSVEYVPHS